MSVLKHFKDQQIHIRDGKDSWFVMTDKYDGLAIHSIPVAEIEVFLEGTTFEHLAGMIPRFGKPRIKKQTIKKSDGNT